jgi:hypothetical protein
MVLFLKPAKRKINATMKSIYVSLSNKEIKKTMMIKSTKRRCFSWLDKCSMKMTLMIRIYTWRRIEIEKVRKRRIELKVELMMSQAQMTTKMKIMIRIS